MAAANWTRRSLASRCRLAHHMEVSDDNADHDEIVRREDWSTRVSLFLRPPSHRRSQTVDLGFRSFVSHGDCKLVLASLLVPTEGQPCEITVISQFIKEFHRVARHLDYKLLEKRTIKSEFQTGDFVQLFCRIMGFACA